MRSEVRGARTKPAELNTAPLPELKSGLSESHSDVRMASPFPSTDSPLAFHDANGCDDGIHRLATCVQDSIPRL